MGVTFTLVEGVGVTDVVGGFAHPTVKEANLGDY